MTLNEKDFAKLKDMRELCAAVESFNAVIESFLDSFNEGEIRRAALQDLYESDWMGLAESDRLSDGQRRELEQTGSRTKHSILAQDTIWNALSDNHQLRVRLIKSLADSL